MVKKLFSSKSEAVTNGGAPAAVAEVTPPDTAPNAMAATSTKPASPTDIPSKQPQEDTTTSPISPSTTISISPTDTRTQVLPRQLQQPPPQPAKLDTLNLPPLEADPDSASSHSPGSDTQAAVAPSSPLDSTTSPKTVIPNSALLSPASAEATSPTLTTPAKPRPSVHFLPSVRTFLEAQAFGHQQRYNLSCGALQVFDRPPTSHYRFNTLRENGVRGTYAQLVTSASNEGWGRTWDSCTPLPSFAARYQNTYVTRTERTVYWECEILSLGFSKFSSLDGGTSGGPQAKGANGGGGGAVGGAGLVVPAANIRPSTSPVANGLETTGVNSDANGGPPRSADNETIAALGLTRTVSISAGTTKQPQRPSGVGLGIGFVVKCVSPETVAYVRRRSSLRPNDEMPSPSSVNGAGVFWWSEDADVHIDGKRTHKHVPAGVKDVIGIGITYRLAPGVEPNENPPPEEKQRRRSSYMAANLPAEELQQIPADIFMVVNGIKYPICSSDSTNPFEPKIPDYMLGLYDVFPCIVVQGAGVECKIRIGEAVTWTGEGGKEEMARLALGEKKGSIGTGRKDSLLLPGTRKKKGGWWRAFSWGSGNGSKEDIVKEEEGATSPPPTTTTTPTIALPDSAGAKGEEGPKGEEEAPKIDALKIDGGIGDIMVGAPPAPAPNTAVSTSIEL